jgi:hypothetical protein
MPHWKRVVQWCLGGAGSLLAMLSLGFANELWSAKDRAREDITTLQAENAALKDAFSEVHADLRELRQDVKELLRR